MCDISKGTKEPDLILETGKYNKEQDLSGLIETWNY